MMLDKAKGFRKGRRDRSATCGAVSGRSVLALLSMGLCGLMAPTSGMAAACPPPPSVQTPGTIPGDVCGGAAAGSAESDFDALAWQAFRYLVWPASAASRRNTPSASRR